MNSNQRARQSVLEQLLTVIVKLASTVIVALINAGVLLLYTSKAPWMAACLTLPMIYLDICWLVWLLTL